jgi:hypothetical protein
MLKLTTLQDGPRAPLDVRLSKKFSVAVLDVESWISFSFWTICRVERRRFPGETISGSPASLVNQSLFTEQRSRLGLTMNYEINLIFSAMRNSQLIGHSGTLGRSCVFSRVEYHV